MFHYFKNLKYKNNKNNKGFFKEVKLYKYNQKTYKKLHIGNENNKIILFIIYL